MKEPPASLPPANSRAWHTRRWWDWLGYLRARSLSNPKWPRDTRWLAHLLARQRGDTSGDETELYDAAIAAARRYPRTAAGAQDAEAAWDEVLEAVDRLLILQYERRRVRIQERGDRLR